MSISADILKEIHLFQSLSEADRQTLCENLVSVLYPAGAVIFHAGEPGDSLYVITSGRAEVYVTNNTGEVVVLEVAGRGDFFGEISLLDSGPRTASVRAVDDVEAMCLSRERLEAFLEANPGAAISLLTAAGRRLRVSAEKIRHTATRNVNEEAEDKRTLVQKSADWIAEFAGSIPFLMLHVVWFSLWLILNSVDIPGVPKFDPYPYGFLTLTVSLEAIFLSVFVLLSQNRQAAKDRVRADIEYDVNLKAELEIMHLHEKFDRLNADLLDRLHKIQGALSTDRTRG